MSAEHATSQTHILGLDIGANSIGWALLTAADGQVTWLAHAGVRVFAAGVEGDIESGRDQSRATARRDARLRRRMLERRRRRLTTLARILQRAGLLPPSDLSIPQAAIAFFAELDESLFPESARHSAPHLLPYRLRARALDEPLTPHELGRALYHLAQRRGFASNRRTVTARAKERDERSVVKQGISHLAAAMLAAGARTLGEYFSHLDPQQERIRQRWTDRHMFQQEFEHIWAAQTPHHPAVMTEDLKRRIHRAIFFQRPLKTQKHLVGHCELEPQSRRAPLALLASQRFRLLQKVNDLEIVSPDGVSRKPEPQERARLLETLEHQGDVTFGKIRTLLGLRGHTFNFETEAEKGLIGNRTASKLAAVFGERWAALSTHDRDRIVDDLRSIHNHEALKRRAQRVWALDEQAAEQLADVALEDGYCSLSRKALAKILPLLEQGIPYATARKQLYGERPAPRALTSLPRVKRAVEVRNPAVERALTETRRLVNAIVREHGQPAHIRIELARDLKKPRKDRQAISLRNARNRTARAEAAARLVREARIPNPRPSDILKWLLAEECGWQCPYTGRSISVENLFGDAPQFDVEHIIPLSRCLDDSFFNKTLCEIAENRSRKTNRTPWEAYAADPDRWDDIIGRVKRFQGSARDAKLERFQLTDLESLEDFTTRQLNDTRYVSRLAVRYLGLLYGAGADGVALDGARRLQAGRGQVTQFLRDEWGLNSILGGGDKTRDDHRQHAVDAVAIALTDAATVKRLSDAAQRAPSERRRRFGKVAPPWPAFLDDVRAAIERLVVSHRVSRKVTGAMHQETIYSKPHKDPNGRDCVHVRKPLHGLSKPDLEDIVDPAIRQRVMAKLAALGMADPAKAFAKPENHPTLTARDGREIPIHRVRIRRYESTVTIGEGPRQRQVQLGSNHHIEIVETADRCGQPRWEGVVVSTYEAMRRLRARQPIVRRDHGPDKRFVFSLAGGEIIQLDEEDGSRGLYVVRTVGTNARLAFAAINDARKKEDIIKQGAWNTAFLEPLRKRNCRKVTITPLGEVRWAND